LRGRNRPGRAARDGKEDDVVDQVLRIGKRSRHEFAPVWIISDAGQERILENDDQLAKSFAIGGVAAQSRVAFGEISGKFGLGAFRDGMVAAAPGIIFAADVAPVGPFRGGRRAILEPGDEIGALDFELREGGVGLGHGRP